MLKKRSLRFNFASMFVANIVYSFAQWSVLAGLAKFTSMEMVGRYCLGIAFVAPVMVLTNLQLREILFADQKSSFPLPVYVAVRVLGSLLQIGISLSLAGMFQVKIIPVISALSVVKAVEALSDILYGVLQKHERMGAVAVSRMMAGAGGFSGLLITVILFDSLVAGLMVQALVLSLILVAYDWPKARALARREEMASLRPDFAWRMIARLSILAAPMGLAMGVNMLNVYLPRHAVFYFLGESQLGIYATLASLVMVGTIALLALGQSAGPRLAAYYVRSEHRRFSQLSFFLIAAAFGVGAAGVCGAWFFGEEVLRILFNSDVAGFSDALPVLLAGGVFLYMRNMTGISLTAMRRYHEQLVLMLVSIVITAGVYVYLVPRHNLMGGAYAFLCSSAASFLLYGAVFSFLRSRGFPPSRISDGEEP